MSLTTQTLRICAVALLGCAVLALTRGLPAARSAQAEAGVAACGAQPAPQADEVAWISQVQARALADDDDVAFVDCRPREQYEAGHVSGALHLPPEQRELAQGLLPQLLAARTVITYCDSACDRSSRMASYLRASGVRDVRVLEGGMPAWLENGYPAESGTCLDCGQAN